MGLFDGILGAGLSTIGNLVGNGISFNQQKQLAADQFNYNKQLMQMQMDFNKPSNQMLEYRKAGINPYASLGNNTSISSSSVGQGNAPSLHNLGGDAMQVFSQLYNADSQKELMKAQAQVALSESKEKDALALKNLSDAKGKGISNDILEYQANDFKKQIALQNNLLRSEIAEKEQQAALLQLQGMKQIAENENYSKIVGQQLAESVARVKLMATEGRLNQAQATQAIASAILIQAQTVGVKISNKTANALALDYIEEYGLTIDEKREEVQRLRKENEWYGWNHTIGSALQGVGLFVSPSKFFNMPNKIKGFH